MFDTYGPYTLSSLETHDVKAFWEKVENDPTHNVRYGIGVYIVAVQDPKGKLIPMYVGQTYRSFSWRLKEHFKSGKFANILTSGPLTFFFLARATNGKIKRSTERIRENKGLKSIHQLEFALIGTCLKLNPKLQNMREASFHKKFWVPGYIDDASAPREKAARELGIMLKR